MDRVLWRRCTGNRCPGCTPRANPTPASSSVLLIDAEPPHPLHPSLRYVAPPLACFNSFADRNSFPSADLFPGPSIAGRGKTSSTKGIAWPGRVQYKLTVITVSKRQPRESPTRMRTSHRPPWPLSKQKMVRKNYEGKQSDGSIPRRRLVSRCPLRGWLGCDYALQARLDRCVRESPRLVTRSV